MLRKLTFIVAVLLLSQFLFIGLYSCKNDISDKCRLIETFTINAIDNGGVDEKPVENNTVYAKALIIRIVAKEAIQTCTRNETFLFVNTAFASYKERAYKRDFVFDSTRIFANQNYDALHPIGVDLKDLFLKKGNDYYLMSAPDDTSLKYTFRVENVYRTYGYNGRDSSFDAISNPLKLKK